MARRWSLSISKENVVEQKALEEARYRLFGALPTGQKRNGNKFLKRALAGPSLTRWYFPAMKQRHIKQFADGVLDEKWVHRQFQLAELRRRGKGPPKKGEGKRAKK